MLWKIVLKGDKPSGRVLAVLYARTGDTIDVVRKLLDSPRGMLLQSGLTKEGADNLISSLPDDGTVQMLILPDQDVSIPVLMGYRPGSRGRLRVALQKLSGLSTEEVIKFIGNIPIVLKSDTDRNTAEQIKLVLERSGGIVEIRSKENLGSIVGRKKKNIQTGSRSSLRNQPISQKSTDQSGCDSSSANTKLYTDYVSWPPVISSGTTLQLSLEIKKPDLINFQPPEINTDTIPSIQQEEIDKVHFLAPYKINFTIPLMQIPIIGLNNSLRIKQPSISESSEAILIYLFPVSQQKEKIVLRELSSFLKLSEERILHFIRNAPIPFIGFRNKADALVILSELTKKEIPVSLVSEPNYSSGSESTQKSFLGWLNGYKRAT